MPNKPDRPISLVNYPTYDAELADNPELPGRSALDKQIPKDVQSCRARLRDLAVEMITATPARVKQINQETQRLRVATLLLTEADSGESHPDTYKEMGALNRMLAGESDLDDEEGDVAARQAAESVMAARGIEPTAARRIIRTLESLSAMTKEEPAHGVGDAPPDIGRRRRQVN